MPGPDSGAVRLFLGLRETPGGRSLSACCELTCLCAERFSEPKGTLPLALLLSTSLILISF